MGRRMGNWGDKDWSFGRVEEIGEEAVRADGSLRGLGRICGLGLSAGDALPWERGLEGSAAPRGETLCPGLEGL